MPSLFNQFLPRDSSSAKTDFIRFPELFAAGARRDANCGGATTRAVVGVCGTTGGLTGGGVIVGATAVAMIGGGATVGWDSQAAGTSSCLAAILLSVAGVVSAARRAVAGLGHLSIPPACTLPHQTQNFAAASRAAIPGTAGTDGGVGGNVGSGVFVAGICGFSGSVGFSATGEEGFSIRTVLSIGAAFSTDIGAFSCAGGEASASGAAGLSAKVCEGTDTA